MAPCRSVSVSLLLLTPGVTSTERGAEEERRRALEGRNLTSNILPQTDLRCLHSILFRRLQYTFSIKNVCWNNASGSR